MRRIPTAVHAVLLAVLLSSCELPTLDAAPIDTSRLAPLTSREQSLIFAADGATQQGNYAAAERDYMAAVSLSQGHVEAHVALAQLYAQQQQPQKQHAVLERALELQPNHPRANYMMGKIALDENRNHEAREHFTRGLQSQPENIDLAVGQAVANDMLGNHEKAQATYTRIMRMNPKGNFNGLRTNLAMSYLLSGAAQKAVDVLKAEAKKPDASIVTKHNLALAYGLLGRKAEATKLLEGDIDEETRLLSVARLREYIKARNAGEHPAVPKASIAADESPAPAVKPAAIPKPVIAKPAAAKPTVSKPATPAPTSLAPALAKPAPAKPVAAPAPAAIEKAPSKP